jgi:hypothetical protein
VFAARPLRNGFCPGPDAIAVHAAELA